MKFTERSGRVLAAFALVLVTALAACESDDEMMMAEEGDAMSVTENQAWRAPMSSRPGRDSMLHARLAGQMVRIDVDRPLHSFSRWMREHHDLDVMLGNEAIETHWLDRIAYRSIHPETLGEALTHALAPHGLVWEVRNGLVYVETGMPAMNAAH